MKQKPRRIPKPWRGNKSAFKAVDKIYSEYGKALRAVSDKVGSEYVVRDGAHLKELFEVRAQAEGKLGELKDNLAHPERHSANVLETSTEGASDLEELLTDMDAHGIQKGTA